MQAHLSQIDPSPLDLANQGNGSVLRLLVQIDRRHSSHHVPRDISWGDDSGRVVKLVVTFVVRSSGGSRVEEEGEEVVSGGMVESFGVVEAEGLESGEEGERAESGPVDHGT